METKYAFVGLAIGSFILGVGLTKLTEGMLSKNFPLGIILTVAGFFLTAFALYYNNKKK
jgi:uncharacterized membrane protein YqaE (UPF0057 family)